MSIECGVLYRGVSRQDGDWSNITDYYRTMDWREELSILTPNCLLVPVLQTSVRCSGWEHVHKHPFIYNIVSNNECCLYRCTSMSKRKALLDRYYFLLKHHFDELTFYNNFHTSIGFVEIPDIGSGKTQAGISVHRVWIESEFIMHQYSKYRTFTWICTLSWVFSRDSDGKCLYASKYWISIAKYYQCCQDCDAGRSVPRPGGRPARGPGLLHLPAQQGPGVPRAGRLRPVRQVEEGRGEWPHWLQILEAGHWVTSRASNEG